ncbi:MAG: hypothetical protein PHI27_09595 [Eubacteriales bacterium]|nr:hypothetical protein [Eubacteriales bacterium]MDD3882495.1 hypothetical protein [Eubacteriales bacterium]MDD4512795.1 hypothetical protein [Eubacteriales bacterium]
MDKSKQKKMTQILQKTLGMHIYRVYRAADMPCIVFASKDSENEDGDFHIHAECPVRVSLHGVPLLCVNDMYLPDSNTTQEEFNKSADKKPISMYDERAKKLERASAVIKSAECSEDGDLLFAFDDESCMTVFPIGANEDEEWRIIDKGGERHIVYRGNGTLEMIAVNTDMKQNR